MANKMTGRIHTISATETIPTKSGSNFTKREVILDCKNTYNGQEFHNFPKFEFAGDELCKQLDNYKLNDLVTIYFDLSGSNYTDAQGNEKNYTRVRGWKIEEYQRVEQQPQQQAAQPQPVAPQVQQQPYQPQQTSMFDALVSNNDDMPF